MLFHLVKGLGNKAIARQLYLSVETIKTHRRNLLRKLQCEQIAELMLYHIFF
ncbi:response regulator transcription factor [Niabella drilacis]|uniref:response regulator transcription factor n=1 Tax=Niabella drilacis (strain DSM 25811 / CCM 8410 / CCUG 62505 / LMG 26954 / E90) TaxID=1285928 RepID=UPI00373FDFD6